MPKIAFIGAGSLGFTRGLVRDILTFPALADSTISLMDIDPERLEFAKTAVTRIVEAGKYPAKVEATLDRRQALDGADAVLCTILAAPVQVWRHDIEVPKKYGVDTNVGDTRGPSGIFRALRTIPVMVGICKDMEELCPDAILLNYTNPMAMLCRAMQRESAIRLTGLCHSVQGTAMMLAHWIGAPMEEVTYVSAGINHQSFFIEYQWNGKDAYPLIHEAIKRPEIYQEEIVRNEMCKHLGYYVTESSGHNSEYNAWFRKRPDLIEKYCTHGTGWNPGEYAYIVKRYLERGPNESLIIRNNHVHSNVGIGLWLDVYNRNAIIEDNLVEDNYGSGIMDELNVNTTIRNNIVRNNRKDNNTGGLWGGAEILIVNAEQGDVYGNDITVSGRGRGIIMIYESYRSQWPSRDYAVYDNTLRFLNQPEYQNPHDPIGGISGGAGNDPFWTSNNVFDRNTYYVQDGKLPYWFWGEAYDWEGFRSRGHEANGRCLILDTGAPC